MTAILRKLGASNRTQAALLAGGWPGSGRNQTGPEGTE